jgi:hypothetical protein
VAWNASRFIVEKRLRQRSIKATLRVAAEVRIRSLLRS